MPKRRVSKTWLFYLKMKAALQKRWQHCGVCWPEASNHTGKPSVSLSLTSTCKAVSKFLLQGEFKNRFKREQAICNQEELGALRCGSPCSQLEPRAAVPGTPSWGRPSLQGSAGLQTLCQGQSLQAQSLTRHATRYRHCIFLCAGSGLRRTPLHPQPGAPHHPALLWRGRRAFCCHQLHS